MLSRKVSGSGLLSSSSGIDRGRVGERLQAALAGLQELHFLREKQSDMVHWALRLDGVEAVSAGRVNMTDPGVHSEEKRLEETLVALKQQLTRLRKQDVGLKTHLQQLDLQINELKLDVCKASTEHLESDSRPSSGFYELSDGGSGSLSNSCTSVYSECLSSSSQTSLRQPTPGACFLLSQSEESRRRSADETSTHAGPPRGLGVRLGIRTATANSDRVRQRPVSTGDLDRVLGPGLGSNASQDAGKASLLRTHLKNHTVDPKYQSTLVSRSGMEVYRYPSPLHAVALQSPIFSLSGDATESAGPQTSTAQNQLVGCSAHQPSPDSAQIRQLGYISKLLQRSTSKMNLQGESSRDGGQVPLSFPQEQVTVSQASVSERGRLAGAPCPQASPPQKMVVADPQRGDGKRSTVTTSCPQQNSVNAKMGPTKPEAASGMCRNASCPTSHGGVVEEGRRCNRGGEVVVKEVVVPPKAQEKKLNVGGHIEERREHLPNNTVEAQAEFVRAQFVPAGSQRVKVRQADKKTKAVKLRRRGSEKPAGRKSQQKHSSKEREREKEKDMGLKSRAEREGKPACPARGRERVAASLDDRRGRSCSDSSLCPPALPSSIHMQPPSIRSSRSSHMHGIQNPDPEQIVLEQARRKQGSRKWPSAMEVLPPNIAQAHGLKPKEFPTHGISHHAGMSRSVSVRSQFGHRGSGSVPSLRPFLRPSISSSSYFSSMDARYPPAALTSRYPLRCESEFSEYSAECASLFHSTIAESSDGESSNFTANRFGDSESSQGSQTPTESDSSLSLAEEDDCEDDEERGLVWAEAALGPTAAGLTLHSKPRPDPTTACRIKASRALKKKIRRFQPAALKVMTLV